MRINPNGVAPVSTKQQTRSKIRDNVTWLPERQSDAEAMEMSAGMVDRFNKLYIRTLRALRDLRRMSPNITVQNAGQVNVGSQQVNVAHMDRGSPEP